MQTDAIELDRLVAPLHADEGGAAGIDLRADPSPTSPYQTLRMLYKKARDASRRATVSTGEDAAQARTEAAQAWEQVFTDTTELLASQTKDFELAGWLIDSGTRIHGFAGLLNTMRAFRELAERYWDEAHPLPDSERGMVRRVSVLRGLFGDDSEGALIAPIRMLPLIPNAQRPLSVADRNMASQYERSESQSERDAHAAEGGWVTLQQFESLAASADYAVLHAMRQTIEATLDEADRLERFLDERCGEEDDRPVSPSFRNLRSVLKDECLHLLSEYCPETEASGGETSPNGSLPGGGRIADGHPGSREEAFQVVLQVAKYFRRTEPQSIVPYALEEVVRWGRTPLPRLLLELADDDSDRKWLFKMVGATRDESLPDDGG